LIKTSGNIAKIKTEISLKSPRGVLKDKHKQSKKTVTLIDPLELETNFLYLDE